MSDPCDLMTYRRYLMIPELLSLQHPRSQPEEHDEMLFIVIHQVYELWFKVALQELDHAGRLLLQGEGARAAATLKRLLTILKVLVGQLDILETMTPVEFASFRDRLETASGFQSAQFRELEFALGHKREAILRAFPDPEESERLRRRLEGPALWDHFLHHLAGAGCPIPARALRRDTREAVTPDPEIQRVLVDVYRTDPALMNLCERLVDLDEGFQEWRYRHLKMVERTIGSKPGTGESAGAAYLATTVTRPMFPDLWDIRAVL